MVRRVFAFAAAILFIIIPLSRAFADIVISELLWSGTDLSTADEWIELTNTGSGAVDLSGWQLTKLSSGVETGMLIFPQGSSIGSGSFFLLSNFDASHSRLAIDPNVVSTDVSLVNEKLLIRLYDALGTLIDAVDDGVGVPFAGSNEDPKASMERIGLTGSGQLKSNWRTATTFLNFDDGVNLFGTPGAPNSTGPSVDTFPPKEATMLAAEFKRSGSDSETGSLTVSWVPSTSLDLSEQLLSFDPPIADGTGTWLPATATGVTFTEGFETGTGITFVLRSRDDEGNTSSGVSTVSVLFPEVRITEVLANPIGADDEEWIEIGNLGSEPTDIAGWILDEGNSPDAYTIVPPSGSALLLQPGEHVSFHKSLTGLPLGNEGEQLTLSRGLTVMDTWSYPETAEEVSYGRAPPLDELEVNEVGFQPFCVPTERQPNTVIPSDPQIIVQSGETTGESKVTINLEAKVIIGSLAHAECNWEYGDGFTSDSCNPPSHTFTNPGTYEVALTYMNVCGERIERSLTVTVLSPPPPPPPPAPSGVEEPPPTGGGERGGGSTAGNRTSCTPSNFSGIRISEFLPNPIGDDTENEWIELENTSDGTVSLCGWELDDREGGSSPHILDTYTIAPRSFLFLERQKTRIAINNSIESIRLFAPLRPAFVETSAGRQGYLPAIALRAEVGGGQGPIEEVSFEESSEGESYALRQDGVYVWTPLLTPGEPNRFREVQNPLAGGAVIISGVLPNPNGKDEGQEWIEVQNIGSIPLDISSWQLDDTEGGSKPYRIENMTLRPEERRRFLSRATGIELTNTHDFARLLDPGGNVVSVLSWRDAASGQIYRPVTFGDETKAVVTQVIDGDTLTVRIDEAEENVRLIGIDAPETTHPFKPLERFGVEAREFLRSLVIGKTVTLALDKEPRDRYGRLLAYVLLEDPSTGSGQAVNVNGELVRRGFAYAYLRYPFTLADLFAAYEAEARQAKWGMWANPELTQWIEQERTQTIPITSSGTIALPTTNTGAYELPEKHYMLDVAFSEVMSNPPKEGPLSELGEYVELLNTSDRKADLGGWILDDARAASSKPYTIPLGTVAPLHRYVVFPSSETHVSLNNEGEELSLTSPDGKVSISVTYPKMKRGEAYAFEGEGWPAARSSPQASGVWCRTATPTPGEPNICRTVTVAALSHPETTAAGAIIQRTTSKRANERTVLRTPDPLASLRVRYRSVFLESEPACPAKLCDLSSEGWAKEEAERSGEPQPSLPPLLTALQSQIIDANLSPAARGTNTLHVRTVVNTFSIPLFFLMLIGTALIRTLKYRPEEDSLPACSMLQ